MRLTRETPSNNASQSRSMSGNQPVKTLLSGAKLPCAAPAEAVHLRNYGNYRRNKAYNK